MIVVRPAQTDSDLEAWRQVRMAVIPNERCGSVEEIRRSATPSSLFLLAELDGELAGSGFAGRSDWRGGFFAPRVLPAARRRGVGTALLCALAEHVQLLGFAEAGALTEDDGSFEFARRFGFREVGRDVEQVRAVGEERPPVLPPEIDSSPWPNGPISSSASTAARARGAPGSRGHRPIEVSLEDWKREWVTWAEGSFVALAGGEIVGCAGLLRDDDDPDRAENSLTAVRATGAAMVGRQAGTARMGGANGLRELDTWTQSGNEAMRAANE